MDKKISIRCSAALIVLIFGWNSAFAYEKELIALASRLCENISRTGKKTIAVLDFTDLDGNVNKLGRFIAEELFVALADSNKGFELVDRTHLKTLMKEHKLAASGVIDPATAQKLGQIAAVDAIVTGTITPFGDNVKVAAKVLDTATARVITAAGTEIPKTKAVSDLLAEGTESAPAQGPAGSPDRPETSVSKPLRIEHGNWRTEVKRCRTNGELVVCELLVTNIGDKTLKVQLTVNGKSLIDDRGGRFDAKSVWYGLPSDSRKQLSADMPPGIPLNMVEVFEGYTPGTRTITLLFNSGEAVFRNVPLEK